MPVYHNGDVALNYTEEGHGRPVFLVHGVGATLESWNDVLKHLPPNRRYIRCDLRGHGASARVPGPYTLEDMAQDVVALADHLRIEKFALVGFSLGGLIAQQVALENSERLDALILISTVAGRNKDERNRVLERLEILEREGPLKHLANSVSRWFTPEFIANNPEAIEARRKAALKNDPLCYMAAYKVLALNDLADRLQEIDLPTLVITGEQDIGSNARMTQLMCQKIKGAEMHILPGLKHSILMEAPQTVADHLNTFLERTDSLSKGARDET